MTGKQEAIEAPVLVERRDGVAIITLNRPALFNSVSDGEMRDELVRALDMLADDETVRAVVLTANGTAFCAGGNVKSWAEPGGVLSTPPYENVAGYRAGIHKIPRAFERFPVPVVCAVNGAAIGAGCDIACMCDIRIASDKASFAVTFARMGLVPGDGGAWFLPRIVGQSKAREMLFTGDRMDADEALTCGLVSRVVAAEGLLKEALSLAQRIAANSSPAIRMTKQLLGQAESGTLESILTLSATMQSILHSTHDHKEAVAAFIGKRPPKFEGH